MISTVLGAYKMTNSRIISRFRGATYALAMVTAGAILSSAPASAGVFKITLTGSFTSYANGTISPPLPFAGSFDVDTNAAPVQTLTEDGFTVTGYANAAISAVSIVVPFSGLAPHTTFSSEDIVDRGLADGQGDAAVYFSAPLSAGTNPFVSIAFAHEYRFAAPPYLFTALALGQIAPDGAPSPYIGNALEYHFIDDDLYDFAYGTVSAQITAIPEPASLSMMLAGLLALGLLRRSERSAPSQHLGPCTGLLRSR
jgi:hypothetical protein